MWTIFKSASANSFVLEKQFRFEGCAEWVTKMIYEPLMNRVYAISEQSVSVLNFRTRTVKIRLEDVHDAPLTSVCWYPTDQFYITSCSRGLIRIWSPHHSSSRGETTNTANKPSMLHSFNAHSKAVAGMTLHPQPGMLVSAGMDGFVKVFDLESFTVLQTIYAGDGIGRFSLHRFQNYPVCLLSFSNGDISMWRIDSCCSDFGECASDIVRLTAFETLLDPRRLGTPKIKYTDDDTSLNSEPSENVSITFAVNTDPSFNIVPVPSAAVDDMPPPPPDDYLVPVPNSLPGTAPGHLAPDTTSTTPKPSTANKTTGDKNLDDGVSPMSDGDKTNIIAFSGLDLQVIAPSGDVRSRVDADALTDGVRTYTYSVFQQLIFCLMESGDIRIFCAKSPYCVLLREIFVGSIGTDTPLAVTLCDGLALTALRSATTSKDMRGNPSPINIDEALLVGTSSGTLLVLDTFQECATISIRQIFQGRVEALKYRRARNELVGLGRSLTVGAIVIKVWKVPEMTFTHEIICDKSFSCWEISPSMNYICVGCTDGFSRLFNLITSSAEDGIEGTSLTTASESGVDSGREVAQGTFIEVLRQEGGHEAEITCISFCDELRAFATAAMDSTIKFWDYEKRYIRAVLFDSPPRDIQFNQSPLGSLLVTQKAQIVTIAMSVWEGNGLLQLVKDQEDPWDMGWLDQDAPARITSARAAKRRTTSRGSVRPGSGGDAMTFLTEDQRQMPLLDMISLTGDEKGLISADDYWKYYSALGDMTTIFPREKKRKQVLNVRSPRFELPVRHARKRFAVRMKQKMLMEQEKIDEIAVHEEEDDETRPPQQADPIEPGPSSADSIRKGESPHEGRHAFIRPLKALQTISRMSKALPSKSRKKTVVFNGEGKAGSGDVEGRSTMVARPPSGGGRSALSLVQQRSLIEASNEDDEDGAGIEFSEEYFVKPNGPLNKDSNNKLPSALKGTTGRLAQHRNVVISRGGGANSR